MARRIEIISEPTLLEKIIGCLLGVLIGDAMGMPWEMMSRKAIMFATGKSGVGEFSWPYQSIVKDTMHLQPGQYTDDYQLTRAVALSLSRCRGFDLIDCLREHLSELEMSSCGFGNSTKSNLEALRELWKASNSTKIPVQSLQGITLRGEGTGNGVAMKIAPLGLFYHRETDNELLFDHVRQLGSVTHKDPQAFLSAYLVARIVARLCRQSIGFCSQIELKEQIASIVRDLLAELIVRETAMFGGHRTQLQHAMINLAGLINNGKIADPVIVADTLGTGCYCVESVPYAIAMFLRHPTDFRAAVIETINQGGDTDTNAAMVAAMVGANIGAQGIPEEWRTFRKDFSEAGDLALGLYRAIEDRK